MMVAKGEYVVLSIQPTKVDGFIVQDLWTVASVGSLVPKDLLLFPTNTVYVKPDSLEDFGKWKVAHYNDIVGMEILKLNPPNGSCLCSEYSGDEWECPIHGGEEE